MRFQILAFSTFALASQVHAGSIDEVVTSGASRSIERITCERCVTIASPKKQEAIELVPGTQRVEIRNVNGELKVFRTEAWMGGSPVVFVSKAPEGATTETAVTEPAQTEPTKIEPAPEEKLAIDKTKTSAVAADMGATATVEPAKKAFDPNSLQLRLN